MSKITICGVTANAKERVRGLLPVTTLASGLELSVPFYILNGAKPGPRLLLTALSHGDATTGFEAIRQVLEKVDLNKLTGTIVAVPCQNPIGFEWDSRNTPTDSYNMNRSYPGNSKGWFTEQLTAAISPLCDEVDMLIDWHGGGYGCAINYVLLKYSDDNEELNQRIHDMGYVYGLEYLYAGPPAGPAAAYSGSLTELIIKKGKPAIVAEVGAGCDTDLDIVAGSVKGVFNVMKHNNMYDCEIELPKEQWMIKTRPLLRPKNGGVFYPMCKQEYLNKVVPKGTVIGVVRNPLTLETIEEIKAPCEETVFLNMRTLFTKVHPGDYAYILGERKDAERKVNW